jgi:hypothetical protein
MANIIFLENGDKERNSYRKGKLEIDLREKDERSRDKERSRFWKEL